MKKNYDKTTEAESGFTEAFQGWTIVKVLKTTNVEGGLTFILSKDNKIRKVILGYTELGEWIEHMQTGNA